MAPPTHDDSATLDASLAEAVKAVRARTDLVPAWVLVLGSGLGALAEDAAEAVAVPGDAIPGYPTSTVAGHEGRFVLGRLAGRPVAIVQGRVHAYEGHPLPRLAVPVRLAHALGARRLLVTNAAGGIHPDLTPGTLMFITGHLNAVFGSPLAGGARPPRARIGGLAVTAARAPYYDADWLADAERTARALGIPTRRGVYLWTRGPSYETKAEIRAFARLGADAVGMSTVPEVIAARALGMRVLGLSTITNRAAGLGHAALDHDDVLAVGRRVRQRLARLVAGIVERRGTKDE
jgi:purine-nucleoside phosphorylase